VDRGPLRKIVDRKMRLWVCADQDGATPFVLYEGHDPAVALAKCHEARTDQKWSHVRIREMGMDVILECGHAQLQIGPPTAARRRCRACWLSKPLTGPLRAGAGGRPGEG
jgi:hypothetical protein